MNPVAKVKDWSQRSAVFYGDVRGEMKKVSWPGRDEVTGTTGVVIAAVAFFGLYLGVVDFVLGLGLDGLLDYFSSGG